MKAKVYVGVALLACLVIVLVSGIVLHLKSHGILIQPRGVIKAVHWTLGYAMAVLFFIHWAQFRRMLTALKNRVTWFYADTWLLVFLFLALLLTGMVKMFSPVKIPHLGLWHYGIGVTMSLAAVVHLVRGVSALNRLRHGGK